MINTTEEAKVDKITSLLGVNEIKELKNTQARLYDMVRNEMTNV